MSRLTGEHQKCELKGVKRKNSDNGSLTLYTVGWENFILLLVINWVTLTTSMLAMCGYF